MELRGKSSYHARVCAATAQSLLKQGMPVLVVKQRQKGAVGGGQAEAGVGGSDSDHTTAVRDVYILPPILYPDSHWYIKIGNSPFDPSIADLPAPALPPAAARRHDAGKSPRQRSLARSAIVMLVRACIRYCYLGSTHSVRWMADHMAQRWMWRR